MCLVECMPLVGTYTKLRKATISVVMSARPSFCASDRMEQLGSNWTEFYGIRKSVEKIQVSLKSEKNNEHFA